jgi:hypothetical protein
MMERRKFKVEKKKEVSGRIWCDLNYVKLDSSMTHKKIKIKIQIWDLKRRGKIEEVA